MEKPARPRAKKNFYKSVLAGSEKSSVNSAASIEGLENEIALLRVRVKSLLETEPSNTREILQTTNMLARLLQVQKNLALEDRQILRAAADCVSRDIAASFNSALPEPKP